MIKRVWYANTGVQIKLWKAKKNKETERVLYGVLLFFIQLKGSSFLSQVVLFFSIKIPLLL